MSDIQPHGRHTHATTGPTRPEALYAARTRPSTPRDPLPGSLALQKGRAYLALPPAVRFDALTHAWVKQDENGACYMPMDGVPAEARQVLSDHRPFYWHRHIYPVQTDLIPATSWGASLANLVTRTQWEAIRRPALDQCSHQCELCGERNGNMEVHEVWEYHAPMTPEAHGVGIQRLAGLYALCELCHEMFHIGRAQAEGHMERAATRLRVMNSWSIAEGVMAIGWLRAMWTWRNQFRWALDLSTLQGLGALHISSKATLVKETGWLSYPGRTGGVSYTALMGVEWQLNGVVHPNVMHDSVYEIRG